VCGVTALIIVSSIVLVIALLLSFSLTVYVCIKEEVSLSVGAFGYKHKFDFDDEDDDDDDDDDDEQEEKNQKKKRKKDKDEQGKTTSTVNEKTLGKTIKFVFSIIKSVLKPTGKLLSHIRITKFSLYMTVCGEDADETAIKYGQVSMGVYNLLGHLDNLIKVKIKGVDIISDFVSDEPQYDIYFKVKLRLCHILWAGLRIFTRFLVNTIKNKRQQKPLPQKQEKKTV